jgi:hypothetical protein
LIECRHLGVVDDGGAEVVGGVRLCRPLVEVGVERSVVGAVLTAVTLRVADRLITVGRGMVGHATLFTPKSVVVVVVVAVAANVGCHSGEGLCLSDGAD